MSSEPTPYVSQKPGDLITAEAWNDVQLKIYFDIGKRIEDAIKKITVVPNAENAYKFDNKAPKAWTDELDTRYAPKVHDHEGLAAYRRYMKHFDASVSQVLLKHDLGRFPLVDVYELLPVSSAAEVTDCKLLFYYGHADAEKYNLWVKVYRDRVPMGLPFEKMLTELGIEYEDDDTIEDVLNDLWNGFMKNPNDEIKHCTTPWVNECCGKRRTVGELKKADQWTDLYLAIKPRKCGKGADLNLQGVPTALQGPVIAPACQVEVTQVNYETLHVMANGLTGNNTMDLMILLRS